MAGSWRVFCKTFLYYLRGTTRFCSHPNMPSSVQQSNCLCTTTKNRRGCCQPQNEAVASGRKTRPSSLFFAHAAFVAILAVHLVLVCQALEKADEAVSTHGRGRGGRQGWLPLVILPQSHFLMMPQAASRSSGLQLRTASDRYQPTQGLSSWMIIFNQNPKAQCNPIKSRFLAQFFCY
jgi:hypothetical protein